MTREQALKQIWRKTHRDYKGKIGDTKFIMVLRRSGSCLVSLDSLTEDEIKSKVKGY